MNDERSEFRRRSSFVNECCIRSCSFMYCSFMFRSCFVHVSFMFRSTFVHDSDLDSDLEEINNFDEDE